MTDPIVLWVTGLLAILSLLLIGFAAFVSEPLPIEASVNSNHVYRLPIGSRRVSDLVWTWQNDTVKGKFTVHMGTSSRRNPSSSAGTTRAVTSCCGKLDGRLFTAENYQIEAANDGSFTSSEIISTFSTATTAWEAVIGNKFGSQSTITSSSGLVFNGKNQVGLGTLDIDMPGALAVTGLWMECPSGGSVSTCPSALEITEWDQTYAITEYEWSLTGASNAYDLISVVIHEFGHNVGLDDLYSDSCVDSTMYGYSSIGDAGKRSIDSSTKQCAKEHYGLSSGSTKWMGPTALVFALILSV